MALTIRAANQRLLKLAKQLEDISTTEAEKRMPDFRPAFDMAHYVHQCGSPSCAWGWWVAWNKERLEKKLPGGKVDFSATYSSEAAVAEFKLTWSEQNSLFGYKPGRSKDEEVRLIREFVAERQRRGHTA